MEANSYSTPNFDFAWNYNVSIGGEDHFEFGASHRLASMDEVREVVGCIIGSFRGHTLNLLSEIEGTFDPAKLRSHGKATVATDLRDDEFPDEREIDMTTKRVVDIRIGQVRHREHTVLGQ